MMWHDIASGFTFAVLGHFAAPWGKRRKRNKDSLLDLSSRKTTRWT